MWKTVAVWQPLVVACVTVLFYYGGLRLNFSVSQNIGLATFGAMDVLVIMILPTIVIEPPETLDTIGFGHAMVANIIVLPTLMLLGLIPIFFWSQSTVVVSAAIFTEAVIVIGVSLLVDDPLSFWRAMFLPAALLISLYLDYFRSHAQAIAMLVSLLFIQFLWTTWNWQCPKIPYFQSRVSD